MTKIIIDGVESTDFIPKLVSLYRDLEKDYEEALVVSEESNSEEGDVELARMEAEMEILAMVLSDLNIALDDGDEVKAKVRNAMIELLIVEATGKVKEDIEFEEFDYPSSLFPDISDEGLSSLSNEEIFNKVTAVLKPQFCNLSDNDLIEEIRRVFGTAEDFSPLDNLNVSKDLLTEDIEEIFPEIQSLLEEYFSSTGDSEEEHF